MLRRASALQWGGPLRLSPLKPSSVFYRSLYSMAYLDDHFLLDTPMARTLFHERTTKLPIIDYHTHLSPSDLAKDRKFSSITALALEGDHYKWRAMRINGVDEDLITGEASDREKFRAWAATVPATIRNPLFDWTHLELRRYFGIEDLLNADNADRIYDQCGEMLSSPEYSARSLVQRFGVEMIGTTDDPVDRLLDHKELSESDFSCRVLPSFRPDRAWKCENVNAWNEWVDLLEDSSDISVQNYRNLRDALEARHHYFHAHGCRISDHGLDSLRFVKKKRKKLDKIVSVLRSGGKVDGEDRAALQTALLVDLGRMDAAKGWTMQWHLGALRNNNTRLVERLGSDAGVDSIDDQPLAAEVARTLDAMDADDSLPQTILYNLNPAANAMLATMAGNFAGDGVPGKVQFGAAWWFLDQKFGIAEQLDVVSSLGLLSRFVGMLTDSRSFMSFPRHEYFRRILCRLIGRDVSAGELPHDMNLLGPLIDGVCYYNAKRYFRV